MKSSDTDTPKGAKKTRGPKKKNKKDPNEPQKPISAYALFFRDTQVAIKGQNSNATFGEVSKIVASMWDSLDPESKNNYKETADAAKKEYVKALAAYRASLLSKVSSEQSDSNQSESISDAGVPPDSPVLEPVTDKPTDEHTDAPAVAPIEEPVDKPVVLSPPLIILSPPPIKSPPTKLPAPSDSEDIVITIDSSAEEDTVDEKAKPVQPLTNSSSLPKQDTSDTAVQNGPSINNEKVQPVAVQICLRNGCINPAIDSPEWDREYCSSDCVVEHCSAAFMAHIATRQRNAAAVAEKN